MSYINKLESSTSVSTEINKNTNYIELYQIDKNWCAYDKTVAKCHLNNYGKIYCDIEYLLPIDDELELEKIINI